MNLLLWLKMGCLYLAHHGSMDCRSTDHMIQYEERQNKEKIAYYMTNGTALSIVYCSKECTMY